SIGGSLHPKDAYGVSAPAGELPSLPQRSTSRWVMDPVRDPGFLATGRAAIAAKTCGQINALTTTPCGSQGEGMAALRHPCGVAIVCDA
ncbi:hypothetical protein, partial [Porphyromonas sp. HMSC065F10]|uniref:hypothetical protein n=1 Tax=Porphyromonas sp. HMSC065F10 TaxID=1739394 RepID=UPI001AEFCD49